MIGSWSSPNDHGPHRRVVLVVAVLALVLLLAWAWLAAGAFDRGARGEAARVATVEVTADGRIGDEPMRLWGPADDLDRNFAAGTVEVPGSHDRIRVETAPGIDEQSVSLRVDAPCGADVTHPDDGAPRASVEREGCDRKLVTIVVPARQLDSADLRRGGADIRALTGPIDRRIADQRSDARRFDAYRDGWWKYVLLATIASLVPPLLVWWLLAQRFFVPPNFHLTAGGAQAVPEVVPATIGAMRTLGTEDVEVGRAFVTTVLDLLARGVLRARRAEVGTRAYGVLVGRPATVEEAELSPAAQRAAAAEAGYPVQYPDDDDEAVGEGGAQHGEVEGAAGTPVPAGASRVGSPPVPGLLEHEQAAIDLLEAWDDAGDEEDRASTWVPDDVQRLEQRLESGSVPGAVAAQHAHRAALRRVAAAHAWRQHAPWQVPAVLAVAAGACVVVGLLMALLADGRGGLADGRGGAAAGWLLVAAGVPGLVLAVAVTRDVRRWRRVDPARAGARGRWLAWRGVLATSETIDDRSLALAVGTRLHPDLPRAVSPTGTIGIDAITVGTAQALSFMAGSAWDVPLDVDHARPRAVG